MKFFVDGVLRHLRAVPGRQRRAARQGRRRPQRPRLAAATSTTCESWGTLIRRTSRCGLGATSPKPVLTTLAAFPEVYRGRLATRPGRCCASFDAEAAVGRVRRAGRRADGTSYDRGDGGGPMTIEITIDGKTVTAEDGRSCRRSRRRQRHLPAHPVLPTRTSRASAPAGCARSASTAPSSPAASLRVWDGAGRRGQLPRARTTLRREPSSRCSSSRATTTARAARRAAAAGCRPSATRSGWRRRAFPYRYPVRRGRPRDRARSGSSATAASCASAAWSSSATPRPGSKIFTITGRGAARADRDRPRAGRHDERRAGARGRGHSARSAPSSHKGVGYDEPIGQRRFERRSVRDRVLGGRTKPSTDGPRTLASHELPRDPARPGDGRARATASSRSRRSRCAGAGAARCRCSTWTSGSCRCSTR